ncbi:MAG: class I mannose-6-phosphate isomerase [Proteobacteria bacterium]|nr:class I mannose-6-phosphate isomerase [Pseudomonadota bacterium]
MTSSSSNSKNKPFVLQPAGKDYLWGGNRLNDDFSKALDMSPLAETWECSTHPDGPSTVGSGEYQGMPLSDLIRLRPDFLGEKYQGCTELPILVKFIDADKDLSVQVHPDDDYAKAYENGQLGKTEMWFVMDANPGSKLIYGLHQSVDKAVFRRSIFDGTVEKYLQKVPVRKGDIFFIEPGTIHALGAGTLVAEIQENSNLTYRIYDYNRVDKTGNKRVLHVDRALAVASLNAAEEPRQPLRVLRYKRGWASELLCRCKYFQVERLLFNTERCRGMAEIKSESLVFQVFLCIAGCCSISFGNDHLNIFKGDCIFVPANSYTLHIHGSCEMLRVMC